MKNQYNKTVAACFAGYIVQAIVNNFTPLLFLFFQKGYRIPLSQITLLVTFNFGIQLLTDVLSIGVIEKVGYRSAIVGLMCCRRLGWCCSQSCRKFCRFRFLEF